MFSALSIYLGTVGEAEDSLLSETGSGQHGVMLREVFESRAEVAVFPLLGKHWHPEIMAIGIINDCDPESTKKARTRGNLS